MPKTYVKKKSGPNATGPKYRTPSHFKGKKFRGGKTPNIKFNPSSFKNQHRG